MQWFNSSDRYGWISIFIHWAMVPVILGLHAVGLWMEDLDYYHPWYRTAPHWHKSIGVLTVSLMMTRLLIKLSSPRVASLANHQLWEKRLAKAVHILFYLAVLVMFTSGYFITTAKGDGFDVFDWFTLPAVINASFNLEDIAGEVHEITAHVLFVMVVIHAAGAIKHHIVDKDATLRRMLGKRSI